MQKELSWFLLESQEKINVEILQIGLAKIGLAMVFCHQNCSDLLWEKIVQMTKTKLLKLDAKGREFENFLRSLQQFIQTVKGQNKIW